jgi:hypothetical protein
MSWMPSADPILGDKRSCDALELVIVPRGVIWAMALPCAAPCRMRRALPLSVLSVRYWAPTGQPDEAPPRRQLTQ